MRTAASRRVLQVSTFRHVFNPRGTPRQRNGFDCGVFAILCASFVGADEPFDYGQEDVFRFFRAMVALECYHMRLRPGLTARD